MLNLKQIPYYNPNIVWRAINGEIVLISLESIHEEETPRVKLFNTVASRTWELINKTRTIEDIIKTLHEEFDVTYNRLLADTMEFLSQLVQLKLVFIKDTPIERL